MLLQYPHRYQSSRSMMNLPVVQRYLSLPSTMSQSELLTCICWWTRNYPTKRAYWAVFWWFKEWWRWWRWREVWEESDESSTVESGILSWLLIFLLRLQAKDYIPDTAIQYLIRFLWDLFCVLGRYSSVIAHIASSIPVLSLCKQYSSGQEFKKFVVCNLIYSHQECIEYNGSTPVTKNCFCCCYPNRTIICGIKTVELSSGKVLHPYKTYCYYGL